MKELSLEGRISRCTYYGGRCNNERPSSISLPFFEYCGEDTRDANICSCGYAEVAHTSEIRNKHGPNTKICENYAPRGDRGYDRHYCGCYGWD